MILVIKAFWLTNRPNPGDTTENLGAHLDSWGPWYLAESSGKDGLLEKWTRKLGSFCGF